MSQTPAFRTVLRGYEPAQVDQRFAELIAEVRARREDVTRLSREMEQLRRALESAHQRQQQEADAAPIQAEVEPMSNASFASLGERIAQILGLAEEEATDVRSRARRSGHLWLGPYHEFVSARIHTATGRWSEAAAEIEAADAAAQAEDLAAAE